MTITMNTTHIPTITELRDVVAGTAALEFGCTNRSEAYGYIERVLVARKYYKLSKPDKGVIRAYLSLVTGFSAATLTRLISQYKIHGHVAIAPRTQPTFHRTYLSGDVVELARIDDIHENLSGSATVKILQREYELFGNEACSRLRHLSVSHLYNLRRTNSYKRIHTRYEKTKPTGVKIGERVKPLNNNKPGYLRVDSVHQGDKDGEKGVYHVNLVDEVTQWEVVVCVQGISEQYMLPALIAALQQFPFVIINFHADNGSEYINKVVARLLESMHAKLTKSRPRHSGDNGLVETKNGAIIRKALGYLHIPRTTDNVAAINRWYGAWFVPYLNFHRPCAYRLTVIDKHGKQKHTYPKDGYMIPYEKLKSLPNAEQFLKTGMSFEMLDQQAYAMSDTQWAEAMQAQKTAMWESIQL